MDIKKLTIGKNTNNIYPCQVKDAVSSSSHYGPFDSFASTGSREDLQEKGRFRYKPAINQSN